MRRLFLCLVLLFTIRASTTPAPLARAARPRLHPLGLIMPRTMGPRAVSAGYASAPASLPASVDLGAFLPATGDQGQVGSCVSWAEGYYLRDWYAARAGVAPAGGLAPMFLYATATRLYDGGLDQGSSLEQPAQILVQQGIAPETAYAQGYFDFTDQPTPAEVAAATPYRITGYHTVWSDTQTGTDFRTAAETVLAGGDPVVLAIAVFPSFDGANAANNVVGPVQPGEYSRGNHAVIAYGYTPAGLLIKNQWGATYGWGGDALLTWGYLASALLQVEAFTVPAPQPSPTATASSTPVPPTATPTATPSPKPSPTVTPIPGGLVPWPHAGITGLPAALPKGTYSVLLVVRDSHGVSRAMRMISVTKR